MKTKRPLRAALLALTGLLLLTCVPVLQHTEATAGQTPAEPAHWYGLRNRLDSLTQNWNQNRFNGCVLVAERGRIVYATGLGYEDRSSQAQPIDTASRFELASVSKPITAVAVLQLMERGLIDLDRPYADYVAEFPDRRITVRMLLNHTSGLPDYLNDEWRFTQAFRATAASTTIRCFIWSSSTASSRPTHRANASATATRATPCWPTSWSA